MTSASVINVFFITTDYITVLINKFFYVLPILLAGLIMIPQWIFILVFMYFFWISVINICAGYIAREDNSFTAMLPVSKRDVVKSKIAAISIIELVHLGSGIIMGIIHNYIYGTFNFFMDMNFVSVSITCRFAFNFPVKTVDLLFMIIVFIS